MGNPLCKVCGLTRPEDVALCLELGVDYTGFIFVPSSPRYVTPKAASSLPKGSARRVGVFAGMPVEAMLHCVHEAKLDFLQLHGGESPEVCRALGPERVIKVLWPESASPASLQADMELFAPVCAYFLLDAGKGGGGTGNSLAFAEIAKFSFPRPWFLAGGLGPENVGNALALCHPDGVDLNSALEEARGKKNPHLLRQAIATVQSYYPL